MKASLAAALASRPRLIVLDEPFTGLDALVRDELIESLLESADGATVFISSHDLAEIESFSSHVGFLHRGRLQSSENFPRCQPAFAKSRSPARKQRSRLRRRLLEKAPRCHGLGPRNGSRRAARARSSASPIRSLTRSPRPRRFMRCSVRAAGSMSPRCPCVRSSSPSPKPTARRPTEMRHFLSQTLHIFRKHAVACGRRSPGVWAPPRCLRCVASCAQIMRTTRCSAPSCRC